MRNISVLLSKNFVNKFFICLSFSFTLPFFAQSSAVTYTFEGAGRFGDCVMIYCKAKFYATQYGLPLLYKPFRFSDQLKLHSVESYWTQDKDNEFSCKKLVRCTKDIDQNAQDTLFIIDLFTSLLDVAPQITHKRFEPVDHWINLFCDEIFLMMQQYPDYKTLIKKMLQPTRPLIDPRLPDGMLTVAVHVRKGGGVDGSLMSKQLFSGFKRTAEKVLPTSYWVADCACPLRFPPDQFYIDQINTLAKLVDGYPLYVQIFTDDAHPQEILSSFKQHCPCAITFTLGTQKQWWDQTLEDIYAMSKFDCLIRPCSFFSGVAQLMGEHKLIVRPDDFCWSDQCLYITDMIYTINNGVSLKNIKIAYERMHDLSLKQCICDVLLKRVR